MKERFVSEESGELARAQAQAVSSLTKSWSDAVGVARVQLGLPGPGTLRPESKPKARKDKGWGMTSPPE